MLWFFVSSSFFTQIEWIITINEKARIQMVNKIKYFAVKITMSFFVNSNKNGIVFKTLIRIGNYKQNNYHVKAGKSNNYEEIIVFDY